MESLSRDYAAMELIFERLPPGDGTLLNAKFVAADRGQDSRRPRLRRMHNIPPGRRRFVPS